MRLPIRTTRAAILVEQHRPLVLDQVELPETLGVGQVLVRVDAAGLCGSQVGEIDGVKGADPYLPHLLGHEGAGEVLAVGPGVQRVRSGDAVVLHWRKAAGIDASPARYRWQGKPLQAGWVTTWSHHTIVAESRVTPMSEAIDPSLAALLGCAMTTAYGVVCREARVWPGESVVVLGSGGVGGAVVMAASLVSAAPLVVVDRSDAKLDLARRLGATHGVLGDGGGDIEALVRAVVGAAGADIVVETTGVPELIQLAARLTHPVGRTVLVGVPLAPSVAIPTLPLHLGKRLIGSHGGGADPEADIRRCLQLFRAGRLPLGELVSQCCRLDDVNDAIAALRRGAIAGRCILVMEGA